MIYQLSEGVGRTRGQKQGGLQKTPTWRNCIITTGEFPIMSANSGEGAVNRTIEVDCHDTKLFDEPKKPATELYSNYGFAGKEFVEHLMEEGSQECVQKLQEAMQDALKTNDTMDKQTASAALILAADKLAEEWIFRDGILLRPEDISNTSSQRRPSIRTPGPCNTCTISSTSTKPDSRPKRIPARARYGETWTTIMPILSGPSLIKSSRMRVTTPPLSWVGRKIQVTSSVGRTAVQQL